MNLLRKLVVTAVGVVCLAGTASADLIAPLSVSFSSNFPFGPFEASASIEIITTLSNDSADQTLTICEGECTGDEFTYSLGGVASIPTGYSFYWGNDPVENVFDGQIAGELLPGQQRDFVFGVYAPDAGLSLGWYGFSTQLQIFAATTERPMLGASTFSGRWEVVEVPEPATLALFGLGLAGMGLARRRKA